MKSASVATLIHVFVLLLSLFPTSQSVRELKPANNGDLISFICPQTPNSSLCEATLRANPSSKGASLKGLGLIMVDSVKIKAKEALNLTNTLVNDKENGTVERKTLETCGEYYTTVVEADVPEAMEAIRTGNYKFAEQGMSDAAEDASECESMFVSGTSPLTEVNLVIHDRAAIALSIAHMLHMVASSLLP